MADRILLYSDAEEAQRQVLDGRQAQIWTAIPCFVTEVDFEQMTISAAPTIQGSIEDENGKVTFVDLPLLINVPIVFPSAGGFTITFPIENGDEVLVIFASRCIDAWWQSAGIQKPMEARMHDLSDGFAIPGPKSIPNVIGGISETDLQIRNNDGSSLISIKANGNVQITAPTVNITGNLVVSGEVTGGLVPIHLTTHVHGGVTTGGSNTGVPV